MKRLKELALAAFCSFGFLSSAGPVAGGGVYIGNGGDSLGEELADLKSIKTYVSMSPLGVLAWFQGQSTQPVLSLEETPFSKGLRKLLDAAHLETAMSNLVILFNEKGPCLSADKGHSDGSVVSVDPAVICISGDTLSKKLRRGNAKVQVEGLILHEISHLFNATEEEAVALQSKYVKEIGQLGASYLRDSYTQKWRELSRIDEHLSSLVNATGTDRVCPRIERMASEVDYTFGDQPFQFFHFPEGAVTYLEFRLWLGLVLNWGRCFPTHFPESKERWMEINERIFGERKAVSLSDFLRGLSAETWIPFPLSKGSLHISRIDSAQDFIEEIFRMKTLIQEAQERIHRQLGLRLSISYP